MPLAATTFPLFQKLPVELRCLIWDFAQPERILTLECGPSTRPLHDKHGNWKMNIGGWLAQPKRILNAVCQESRYQSLRSYKVLLPNHAKGRFSRVEFNQDLDTIYIADDDYLSVKTWKTYVDDLRANGSTVSKLLVDLDSLDFDPGEPNWDDSAKIFQGMEEIFLILGSGPREISRVVNPANFFIRGRRWTRWNGATNEDTARELRTIMGAIRLVADRDGGGKMPVIKIMIKAST
jgi:hypothetical protein